MNVAGVSGHEVERNGHAGDADRADHAFPQPAGTVYPGSATLQATASSGLAVTYTLVSGPATLSGATLTYTGPGTVVVTANQAGNAQYAAAPAVSISITVTQASAIIHWQPATLKIYTGTALWTNIFDVVANDWTLAISYAPAGLNIQRHGRSTAKGKFGSRTRAAPR